MNTTNRRRNESIVQILELCEDQHASIASTPLGAQLMGQLRAKAAQVATLFKTQSTGRYSAHDATEKRRTAARLVRRTAVDLARHARALGRASGLAITLPPLRDGSHRQLIADAGSVLDAVQPLTDAFKATKLTVLDDLPQQIADLDAAMKAQSAGRETHVGASTTVTEVLNECTDVAAAIEPFYLSAVSKDPELIARWKNARRVGPARSRKDDATATAPATAPVPDKPATDKVA